MLYGDKISLILPVTSKGMLGSMPIGSSGASISAKSLHAQRLQVLGGSRYWLQRKPCARHYSMILSCTALLQHPGVLEMYHPELLVVNSPHFLGCFHDCTC